MLVLSRQQGERIYIGENIVITMLRCRVTEWGTQFQIGIEAPRDIPVLRAEVYDRQQAERDNNNASASAD